MTIQELCPGLTDWQYNFLLNKPNHPIYRNKDRLNQVLDNIATFGPVTGITKHYISFKGATMLIGAKTEK